MRSLAVGSIALVCTALCGCKPQPDAAVPDPGAEPSGAVVVVEAPVAPACQARTARGSLALIPDSSDWIIHLAPREIMSSAAWSMFAPALAADQDWASAEQVFFNCGLSFSDVEHVLIGIDRSGEFVVSLAAPSIGRPEVAQCLLLEIQGHTGDEQVAEVVPWAEDSSVAIVEFTDGRAYLFADDLLTIATTQLEAEVGRLGRCEGAAAIDGLGRGLLERVDINAPLWATGRVTPELGVELEQALGIAEGSVREAAATLRLDEGAALVAQVQLQDPATASALTSSIQAMLDFLAVTVPEQFQPVVQRVNIERADTQVILRASASVEELRALTP